MTDRTKLILEHLLQKLPDRLAVRYAPDCCIAACRIALDVLEHFQVPAKVLPCRVLACNEVFVKWAEEHGLPKSRDVKEEPWSLGGWSVFVGAPTHLITQKPTNGKGFEGHLVLYMEDHLLDLTITQASRPHKGMIFKPLLIEYPRLVEEGELSRTVLQEGGGYCQLFYKLIDNDAYLAALDWNHPRRFNVSTRLINELEVLLGTGDPR